MVSNLITGLGGPVGFGENALPVGDDNSSGFIDLRQLFPRGINVFGVVYQGLFVNNNGNVSFGGPLGSASSSVLASGNRPIIAPFLGDVDTRGGAFAPSPGGSSTGANRVWYDLDAASGTVTVTWDDVGRFANQTDAANAFQLRLSAVPGGVQGDDFDIRFNYEAIDWHTSTTQRIGQAVISDGNGVNVVHLPGSGTPAGLLALDEGSNVGDPGRYEFRSRAGQIEPEFSVGPVRIVEGTGLGPPMIAVTIQRTSVASAGSVSYATESLTALAYQDYLPRSGTVFFKPGIASQTILVPVIQDSVLETTETFRIQLSNPNGGGLANPTGIVQIADDDLAVPATPALSLQAARTRESAGSVQFTATLSAAQPTALVASYGLSGQTATTNVDFNATSGTITFAPGATQASFTVPILPDTAVEPDEHFFVSLTSTALPGNTANATGIILDDDGISVGDVVVTERAGGTFASFTVSLGSPLAEEATVSFGTSSGTAAQGLDYTATSGTLTFAPGTTSQAVDVAILDDKNAEQNEQFSLVLSAPSANTAILVGKATALVIDDDGISVGDASVTETSGSTFVDVEITLAHPSNTPVSVDWAVAAGTAGFFDFDINASGTVGFSPGETSETITIEVKGDKSAEGSETFRVVLSNPAGSTIIDASGTVTIIDDEDPPLIVDITDHETVDAAGGNVPVAMTVFLNRLHSLPVTVDVALFEGGATKGVDFIDAPGTVTIPAGQLSATFEVTLLRADQPETNEAITLAISNPTGGAVLPVPEFVTSATANLVIQGYTTMFDLALPAITDAREGEFADAAPIYTLTRRGDMSSQQVVGWAMDLNAGLFPMDEDDLAAISGTVTFAPGQETATVAVQVVDDADVERNGAFKLRLVDLPAGSAVGIEPFTGINVRNDDTALLLRPPFTPYIGLESGFGAISTPNFLVELEGDLSIPRTVTWTITGSGENPADAADFKAMTGTLAIPAGKDQATLLIPVLNDSLIEPREGYTVTLSTPGPGSTFLKASADSFISNDDYKASLSIAKATQAEGSAGGSTAYAFTITLDPAPPRNFTPSFGWKVGPGTAPGTVSANAADFVGGGFLPAGTAAVGLNNATATIIVPVAADTAAELNESFTLTVIDNGTGLEIGKASATILNDDTNLSIAATSANKPEGSGPGPTPYTFTVTRTGILSGVSTAKWSVTGATGSGTVPASAADFPGGVLPTGTFSFAAGQKTQLVSVNVAADRAVELNERFAVTLSAPSSGTSIATASAGGVILNDDVLGTGTLAISRLRASRSEGQSGATDFTFQVTRTGAATGAAAADWTVTGGGVAGTLATTAVDFAGGVLPRGSVSFAAGETTKVVTVQIAGDTAVELNESFSITLGNTSTGVALGTASATGLVWNDDSPGTGTLSIARLSAQKPEGSGGSAPFTFTVTRSGALTGTASADWAVTGGGVAGTTAASGADFVGGQLPNGRVSFTAGQASAVVSVAVAGDIAAELNESFTITLAGTQAGVALGVAKATGAVLNDDIVSTPADQALRGTAGADTFVLGGGIDTVIGLAGRDLFLFQPAALGNGVTNASFLGDFTGIGGEKLDLTAIDAIAGAGTANDAFTFIGTAPFTAPGQLRWEDSGPLRAVFGNVDAGLTPELAIYLSAAGPVQESWLLL